MRTASILVGLALLPSLALAAEIPKGSFQLMTKGTNGSGGTDDSIRPTISSNGKVLAIATLSSNFGAGTYNGFRQVLGLERDGDVLGPLAKMVGGQLANDDCWNSRVSKSGRYIAFDCDSPLGLAGPPGGSTRVFWRDTLTGELRHVSIGTTGNVANDGAYVDSISDDGRYVLFRTTATNMVVNDSGFRYRGFLHDTNTGTTELVTMNDQDLPLDGEVWELTMSGDARFVYFASDAPNLGNPAVLDIYVRDRKLGTTTLVTKSPSGGSGNTASYLLCCSRNGRYALIFSTANNLGFALKPGGIVRFDRKTGALQPIDVSLPGMSPDIYTTSAAISNDGRRVLLAGRYKKASNNTPVPGIFEFDLKTGKRFTVVSDPGVDLDKSFMWVSASANGKWAFFSTKVGLQESNGKYDGYLYRTH